MATLSIVPLTYKEVARFIASSHRHRRPPTGGLFAIGLSDGEKVIGCAVVGRPIARMLDDSWTAEVTRRLLARNASDGLSPAGDVHASERKRRESARGWLEGSSAS